MDRNLQLLGMAKKAGALAVGAEDVSSAARKGKAKLVISARDSIGNALRRARSSADAGHVRHIVVPYTSFELGVVSGRGSPGTVAFLDTGLAAAFMRGLARAAPERYGESADELSNKARAKIEAKRRYTSGKRRTTL